MIDEQLIEDDAFDTTLFRLNLRASEEGFKLSEVEAELKDISKYDGLGWTGRSAVKSAELAGTITAYQAFIMRYREQH